MGHPACGVVGLGSLGELELAIRRFANDKFKTEAWGTRRTPSGRTHGSENHEPWGTPAGGVVGLGSLGEVELVIRVFANDKFRTEGLGHPAVENDPNSSPRSP